MIKDIREWETEFKAQFPRVKLLGEIELTQADFDTLTQQVRAVLKRAPSNQKATERFEKFYPCTFAVFLAHFAARNTNRDFWAALGELLEVPGVGFHLLKWHTLFIDILQENSKKTFLDVGGASNKYVTAIRIHGGIPAYSLRDFFDNMILPAISRPQYAGLNVTELRNALLQRTDVQFFTDSPVRNFFDNSGEIGLAFLGECIKMARAYKDDGEIPAGLDLPAYVIDIFSEYIEKQIEFETKLKSPRLLFDPEGAGLLVDLPQQFINAKDLQGNEPAIWQVSWDEQESHVQKTVRLAFSGRDIVARASQQAIPNPVYRVKIAFGLQSRDGLRIMRRWSLHFLPAPGQPQLLAFTDNPNDEGYYPLLRFISSLPPKTLLILHPRQSELKFEGEPHKLHQPNQLSGDWRDWQAAFWSLEKVYSLRLLQNGTETGTWRINAPADEPALVGGRLHPTADPKKLPLYLGAPPQLHLPHRPGQRWNILLESVWETIPDNVKHQFEPGELKINDSTCEVDLGLVLGAEPVGTFALRFSNNLDIEDELRFRIFPRLQVDGLPKALFPSEATAQSPSPVVIHINLPATASCPPLTPGDNLQISGQYGRYALNLSDAITRADLNLTMPRDEGLDPVRVPFFVTIPRLQWRVHFPGEELADEWSIIPSQRSVAAYHQTSDPVSILVKIPGIDTLASQLQLALIDPDAPDNVLQILQPERIRPGEDILRYSLNQAVETVRHHTDLSVFAFSLRLWGEKGIHSRANLLTLTRSLEISSVWMETHGDMDYTLHWQEPAPLRNRRVFLYPTWQPWNNGMEFSIPDDAHGELSLKGMGLPPSDYEAYFYIAPYRNAPSRSSKPEGYHHHFQTSQSADRLLALKHQIHDHPERVFLAHFERACIHASNNNNSLRDEEIDACIAHHEEARLTYLACFYEWLGAQNETEQKRLRQKMLTPKRIKELYSQTRPGHSLRQTYLQHAQYRTLPAPSAICILEHETEDVGLIIFCMRLLLERNEPRGVEFVIGRLRAGGFSDESAIDLFSEQLEFSLETLSKRLDTPDSLRLFTKLFPQHPKPDALIQALPVQALLQLAALVPETASLCLSTLVLRGENAGVERILALFTQGQLSGDEVTELFGKNPGFVYQTLTALPSQSSHASLLSALVKKYPAETGQNVVSYTEPHPQTAPVRAVGDSRISLSRDHIRAGDKTGVLQALNLLQLGLVSSDQILEIFSVNPKLAYQTLLENPKIEQVKKQIVDLARKFPFETGHIVQGMSIKTPGGWGLVQKIFQSHTARFDIAACEEVDIDLQVSLHPEFFPEPAVVELGNSRIVFGSEADTVFQCLICKEFVSHSVATVHLHHNRAHRGQNLSFREHKPMMPIFMPYEFRPAAPINPSTTERQPHRDDDSLWLGSLPNKQLLRILETHSFASPFVQRGMTILLKKEQDDCLVLLLKKLQDKSLSQELALTLLGANPLLAYDYFDSLPSSKKPVALMQALQKKYPSEI